MTFALFHTGRSLLRAALWAAVGLMAMLAMAQPVAAEPMTLSSVGDAAMGPLMDAWLGALHEAKHDIVRGPRW